MRLSPVLAAVCAAVMPAFGATCDRTCLKGSLDQYLQAILKHDPQAAPLFLGYRHTENALLVKLGEGAWKSVTSIGKVDRRYYDPVSGQAAFFGVLNEGDAPTVTTVRIRVEDRKITEAEWIIARRVAAGINGFDAQGKPQAYAFSPDNLALHPIEQRVVPPAQRLSREELIAITNSYFDGITAHDGSMIMAHPGLFAPGERTDRLRRPDGSRWFASAASPRSGSAAGKLLRLGSPEFQSAKRSRPPFSAGRYGGADRAGLCGLHSPPGFSVAPQRLCRVVRDRHQQDPPRVFGHVLSAQRPPCAELATLRWQLPIARRACSASRREAVKLMGGLAISACIE